jgi:two-component system chemotaxis response regulator CheY
MNYVLDYSKRRFLIVDDEPFMLGLIDRMLKQFKVGEVLRATNAHEAFATLRDSVLPIDCVIADCNMPEVNGLQLLQALRAGRNPKAPREQPFILLTGHGDIDLVKSAIALDVSGYVVKPVPFDKLMHAIDHALLNPVKLRDAAYYEGVAVPRIGESADSQAEEPTEPSAWVVMPPAALRPAAARPSSTKPQNVKPGPAGASPEPEVRFANRRQCALGDLQEGMVLAEDIYGNQDALLLKRGTALSQRLIQRLREGGTAASDSVWIGDVVR